MKVPIQILNIIFLNTLNPAFFNLLNWFLSLLSFNGYNYKIRRDLGDLGGLGSCFKEAFWQTAKKSSQSCFGNL